MTRSPWTINALLLTAFGGGLALAQGGAGARDRPEPSTAARELSAAFARVTRQARAAVVSIRADRAAPPTPFFQPFHPFSRPLAPQPQASQGSGFIVDPAGIILTNNHVIQGAERVEVKLHDGRRFAARVRGLDPEIDLAVLEIEARGLPALPLGRSARLEVGEWVLAIGNPFGLSETVTAGIVSAIGRAGVGATEYEDFIQTDAAINPGNSGGPLIGLDGAVVGINTAIFSRSGGSMGIGFAVPIDAARAACEQILKTGKVERGFLGVSIQDLSPQQARSRSLEPRRGALVVEVTPGSPAATAGLRADDLIVAIDGRPVSAAAVRNRIGLAPPGARLELELEREGATRRVAVTLAARPKADTGPLSAFGLTVAELDEALAERFGEAAGEGLIITAVRPGGPAESAGLQAGDAVLGIQRAKVRSLQELESVLERRPAEHSLQLTVQSRGALRYLVLSRR